MINWASPPWSASSKDALLGLVKGREGDVGAGPRPSGSLPSEPCLRGPRLFELGFVNQSPHLPSKIY